MRCSRAKLPTENNLTGALVSGVCMWASRVREQIARLPRRACALVHS
jgi:hypothetical protein